jgi:hypothetical protein
MTVCNPCTLDKPECDVCHYFPCNTSLLPGKLIPDDPCKGCNEYDTCSKAPEIIEVSEDNPLLV